MSTVTLSYQGKSYELPVVEGSEGEKGIVIARRTVAKYRTELNILPSNLRKVY